MEGLQRSAVSFRRQGSSGLVWDDKFLSGELNQLAEQHKEQRAAANSSSSSKPQLEIKEDDSSARNSVGLTIERSRSNGGRGYRTGKVSPAIEPPSPKVSAFGCCGAFGKSEKTRRRQRPAGKRVV